VELARPLVLGRLPEAPLWPIALLVAYALIGFRVAVALTRRRFVA
jgi:lipooligosaccharide transport system permease protein